MIRAIQREMARPLDVHLPIQGQHAAVPTLGRESLQVGLVGPHDGVAPQEGVEHQTVVGDVDHLQRCGVLGPQPRPRDVDRVSRARPVPADVVGDGRIVVRDREREDHCEGGGEEEEGRHRQSREGRR